MKHDEWNKFYQMTSLYNQVGEVTFEQQPAIGIMEKSNFLTMHSSKVRNNYFEEDLENLPRPHTAEGLFEELFGINLKQLNKLADSFGYRRVNRFYPNSNVTIFYDPLTRPSEEGLGKLEQFEKADDVFEYWYVKFNQENHSVLRKINKAQYYFIE